MSSKDNIKKKLKQQRVQIRRLQSKIKMKEAGERAQLGVNRKTRVKRRVKRNVKSKQMQTNYIPAQKIEGEILGKSSNVINSIQVLPQINVVQIDVELNIDALTKLAYAWSLYAISLDVLSGQTVLVGTQNVGVMYMMAATLAYDLWNATKDNITILSAAPRAYWELRSALTPKVDTNKRTAFSYSFTSSDIFIGSGGIYPTGFPLSLENVSLSWPVAAGALATMNTAIPTLTDASIYTAGPAICQKIWNELKKHNNKKEDFIMEQEPETTAFSQSTGAYVACYDYSTPENQDWTLFSHELRLGGHELWLSVLGLGFGSSSSSNRRGPMTFTDYKGPGSYMHRIYAGHIGRQPKQVIRYKNVYLESFFAAITGSVLIADTFATNVNGGDTIVQVPNSRLLEVSAPQYTIGLLQGILKGFSGSNFIGAFQVTCDGCIITAVGTTQVPSQQCLTMAVPNFYNEMRASLVPKTNHRNGWDFITYPILVVAGMTTANIYENGTGLNPQNLKSLLENIYPNFNVGASSYQFAADTSTLPAYFDPSDVTTSWVEGTQVTPSVLAVSAIHNQLQGNLMMSSPMANYHTKHTLVYYTSILTTPEPDDGYSQYQYAYIKMITNRVPFSANDVSYDLMNVLPSTFMNPDEYRPIYSETSSLDYASEQTQVQNVLMTVVGYAHEVAGEGTETQVSHLSMIAQHEGGGFVNFFKKIGKSMLPAVSGIADTIIPGASNLIDDVLEAVEGS